MIDGKMKKVAVGTIIWLGMLLAGLSGSSLWAGATSIPTAGSLVDMVSVSGGGYVAANIAGEVYWFNGDGSLKWKRTGLGYILSIDKGDVNADGTEDIIVGTNNGASGTLYVLDGINGTNLSTFNAGNPIGQIALFTDVSDPGAGNPGDTRFAATAQYFHFVKAVQLNAGANKQIVGATSFGVVVAFDQTGAKLWQYNVDTNIANCKRIVGFGTGDTEGAGRDSVIISVTAQDGLYNGAAVAAFNMIYCITSTGGAKWSVNPGAVLTYNDVKTNTICFVDANGDGLKDEIAVGNSDGFVRYYSFAGVLSGSSPNATLGSAVTSVAARDTNGDIKEETLVGTKSNGIACLSASLSVAPLWTKATSFAFRVTNQNIANLFTVACQNKAYALQNNSTEWESENQVSPGYASVVATAAAQQYLTYISWDKNVYRGIPPGLAYVEIPAPVTSYVNANMQVAMGQSICFAAFQLNFNANGTGNTSGTWKRMRVDKYVSTYTTTAVADSLIEVQLWEENDGNNYWDASDTIIAKGNFTNGTVWLNMNNYQVTAGRVHTFYIVYKLSPNIGGGQRVSLKVTDNSYLDFGPNCAVSAANF